MPYGPQMLEDCLATCPVKLFISVNQKTQHSQMFKLRGIGFSGFSVLKTCNEQGFSNMVPLEEKEW